MTIRRLSTMGITRFELGYAQETAASISHTTTTVTSFAIDVLSGS